MVDKDAGATLQSVEAQQRHGEECACVRSQATTAPLTLTAPSVAKARSKQFKGRRDMKLADAQAAFLDGEFKKVGGASHSLKVELHSRSLPSLTCVSLLVSLA